MSSAARRTDPLQWLRSLVRPLDVTFGGKTGYCLDRSSGYATSNNLKLFAPARVTLKDVEGAPLELCDIPDGAEIVIFRGPRHWGALSGSGRSRAAAVWFGGCYQLNINCDGAARLIDTDSYSGAMRLSVRVPLSF